MSKWERTRQPKEQKVGWRWLTTKWFRDPSGIEQEYVTVGREGSQSVATIALTPDNLVIVAEQFRPGPERMMHELPGGVVDKNEDIEEAALRELREETGYVPSRIEHIGTTHKSAYSNSVSNYFIAYGCTKQVEQKTDEGEFVTVQAISIEELLSNSRNAAMTDTEALFFAYDKLMQIQRGENEKTN